MMGIMVEIALYQPDIAPNAATIFRMAACLGVKARIIEPAGFVWSEPAFRRAGMDYLEQVEIVRHASWQHFRAVMGERRLVLLTTRADLAYTEFSFGPDDVLITGRESSGVPDQVHREVAARLRIPMRRGMRSLNVAVACAMVTGEALRQTAGFPRQDAAPGGV
jgi:tRNA (cytidine/uridine-2'-O-)-methyltransferase